MKKIFIVLLVILMIIALASCEPKLEKPFIIVDAGPSSIPGYDDYQYQDKHGNKEWFRAKYDAYHIGDTLR